MIFRGHVNRKGRRRLRTPERPETRNCLTSVAFVLEFETAFGRPGPDGFLPGDFDGDGDQDLIALSPSCFFGCPASSIDWFENRGIERGDSSLPKLIGRESTQTDLADGTDDLTAELDFSDEVRGIHEQSARFG